MGKRMGLQYYRRRKKWNIVVVKEVLSWGVGIVVAIFLGWFITYSVGLRTNVIGVSMEPELHNSQMVLINRLLYDFTKPQRGDIVAFLPNGNQNSHYYVKRVIALPGETIQIIDGRVYVNGSMLEEVYDLISDPGIAGAEVVLKSDEYFVMGDNRNNSEDSRSSNIGPVSMQAIVGRVWLHDSYGDEVVGFVN